MPLYRQVGKLPAKRHIVFRNEAGKLYHEELVGTEGFAGVSSLVYHLNPPTMVKEKVNLTLFVQRFQSKIIYSQGVIRHSILNRKTII